MKKAMKYQSNDKQEELKLIIKKLHDGESAEKLQKEFRKIIKDTLPDEIAKMEDALIKEGFPPEEIQKLCDVHAQIFEKALSKVGKPSKLPGHPIHTFIQENKETRKILKRISRLAKKIKPISPNESAIKEFENEFNSLKEIEKHYQRKENQLFSVLEERNFIGPSKVMWGKHDEIREKIRKTESLLMDKNWEDLFRQYKDLSSSIKKMIFLEEKILYPTSTRKLSTGDWVKIKQGERDIGYAWITPSNLWDAELAKRMENKEAIPELAGTQKNDSPAQDIDSSKIRLNEGELTREQLNLLLRKLPFDITFVNENDKVCFYSATEDRIFPRSPAIIGREVQNCHPPKSLHIVNKIVRNFKEKKKDVAEFWIQKDKLFIYIRYLPVYDDSGSYKGVIEVSQEVSTIRSLEGERRILNWSDD